MLESAEAVLALRPSADDGDGVDIGAVGAYPAGSECAFEVRAFFSNDRGELIEDPVTGSLNASVAQWLVGSGQATAPYVTSQGTILGRRGRAHISQTPDGSIWVGGDTHTVLEGTVTLD
jgi:predicted PhzF superfamily epimerase YddE/YHI9